MKVRMYVAGTDRQWNTVTKVLDKIVTRCGVLEAEGGSTTACR